MTNRTTALLVLGSWLWLGASASSPQKVVDFYNGFSRSVSVSWINPSTKARSLMNSGVGPNEKTLLNSYEGHLFEVRELECADIANCKTTAFAVSDQGHEVVELAGGFDVARYGPAEFKRILHQRANAHPDCRSIVRQKVLDGEVLPSGVASAMSACLLESAAQNISDAKQELFFHEELRKKEGELYENATCADYAMTSTKPIENRTWFDERRGVTHNVGVLLDRPASRVHVIENFITEEECQAMEDHAKPKLSRAVVADGAGGHQLSDNRRAMQAGITVPWQEEKDGHPITTISRRVYDYVNHVTGLQIEEHGQENLMSIQYFGKGLDSNLTEADQYKPHCDGDCTGDPHKHGTRVATMVVYCTVPDLGGATNFRNSGLTVRAKKGSGVFFSYMDPESNIMDTGFTEHSGCPVVEGEKKIVTQWVRYGVTKEVPWTDYNSLGILKSRAREQDE